MKCVRLFLHSQKQTTNKNKIKFHGMSLEMNSLCGLEKKRKINFSFLTLTIFIIFPLLISDSISTFKSPQQMRFGNGLLYTKHTEKFN
jgi:hypothetical protein